MPDINRNTGGGGSSFTPQKITSWQTQPSLFERFEAYAYQQMDVTGGAEPERLSGLQVSLGLFAMLEARPRMGRSFEPGDGAAGSARVVIIGDGLWRKRFGGQAEVIGQQMLLNDVPYTVIGVMPRKFRLLREDEAFWLPVEMKSMIADTSLRGFYAIGRLAPGVTSAASQQLADDLADRLQKESPLPSTWGLRVTKKHVARVDETTRTALLVLLGAVAFVLLITCANVANLFLAQAPARQREMAIRSALGAGRSQLIRAVLVESVLLAVIGGGLGVLLARWGVDAILAAAPERMVSMSTTPIEVDGRVLLVAASLTLVTGFVFGLFPALRGSRPNLETTLRSAGQAAARGSYGRLPGSLVVLEVAFAVILLVGAVLMTRTLANLNAIDAGFEPDGLVVMHVALPSDRYPTQAARAAFFDTLSEKLRAITGISDVAVSQGTPPSIGGISFGKPEIEGRGTPDKAVAVIPNGMVSSSYFGTLRIPFVAGRNFTANEPEDAVVVSKAFAEKYWPDGDAVGGRFRMGPKSPWVAVIGIVGSVQASGGGDDRTTLQFYSTGGTPGSAGEARRNERRPGARGGRRDTLHPSAQLRLPATDRPRQRSLGGHPAGEGADLVDRSQSAGGAHRAGFGHLRGHVREAAVRADAHERLRDRGAGSDRGRYLRSALAGSGATDRGDRDPHGPGCATGRRDEARRLTRHAADGNRGDPRRCRGARAREDPERPALWGEADGSRQLPDRRGSAAHGCPRGVLAASARGLEGPPRRRTSNGVKAFRFTWRAAGRAGARPDSEGCVTALQSDPLRPARRLPRCSSSLHPTIRRGP
ncbi:MAG: ABC transporter permease [Acidobacteria bacterium]|nr:ABC transporter permease [Acidobacteriota bacterium]